jgi:hypothetical protein
LVQDEAAISRAHVLQSALTVSSSRSHFAMVTVDDVDDGDGIFGLYSISTTQKEIATFLIVSIQHTHPAPHSTNYAALDLPACLGLFPIKTWSNAPSWLTQNGRA